MVGCSMAVFSHPEFKGHKTVSFFDIGLQAIIAIHNTNLGPALGGCRICTYESEEDALSDALRLSRGMTYKAALARLPFGGGKCVIRGNPLDKSPELFKKLGEHVNELGGRYIIAEDLGTVVADMKLVREVCPYVVGIKDKKNPNGSWRNGDPSPSTAYGCLIGIQAAVKHAMGRSDLNGIRIAVQGVGKVGESLVKLLAEAGAQIFISDVQEDKVQKIVRETGALRVGPGQIFDQDVDVFAPCALGAVINDETIVRLRTKVVAGSANNQLKDRSCGRKLMERGILYTPDYVINAGGLIDVSYELSGYDEGKVRKHIEGIFDTLTEIFEAHRKLHIPTNEIANQLAERRFMNPER